MSTLTLVAVVLVVAVIAYAVYTSIQAGLARTSELKALAPQTRPDLRRRFRAHVGRERHRRSARRFRGASRGLRRLPALSGLDAPASVELDARRAGWGVRQPLRLRRRPQAARHRQHPDVGVDRRSLFEAATVLRSFPFIAGILCRSSARHRPWGALSATRATMTGYRHAGAPGIREPVPAPRSGRTALRRVFTDRVLRFFCENQGWMVEGDGKRLLLNRLSADEVRTLLAGRRHPQ